MHGETTDTDDENWLLTSINETLNAGHVGTATLEEAQRIWKKIQHHVERAEYLVPHITNRYRGDQERRLAEAQLLWIQQEIRALSESLASSFDMIGFLHHRGAPINS